MAGGGAIIRAEISMAEPEPHIATDRARGGNTPHIVRYVLLISLPLVIIGMAIVLGAF